MKKAIVGMSGGVDSSVAALLCQQKGYETVGVMLKLVAEDEVLCGEQACSAMCDAKDARAVALKLSIPFYVLNGTARFESDVITRFVHAYSHGITPNPCADCNRYVKLEMLLEKADELGGDYVVSGHYASVAEVQGRYCIKKGADRSKDQSYMLYALTQHQLRRLLLPLGNLNKDTVRVLAEDHGLVNAHKKDSQDICFVPDGDYGTFIEKHCGKSFPPGNFVGLYGEVYGQHKGIIHYTIGQRKGLGLSFPEPMFVCGIDPEKNEVCLCRGDQLYTRELTARSINLMKYESLEQPVRLDAKIRYKHIEQPAVVTQTGEDELKVVFDTPQRAITKGQAVVLYEDDCIVGGGVIA